MNCLVTGGAGFIGSNLALELEKQGHDVIILDNFLKGNMGNLEGFKGKIIEGDETKLNEIKNIDVVFHLAAITDTTITDKKEMFRNNVEGFRLIIDFCEKNKCKLVYASSGAVYGSCQNPMKEEQELKPLNVYGESKLEIDRIASRSKLKTIVGLRYFNVFGPGEHFKGKMASMIYQLGKQMKAGKSPRIFKYGEQKRDHIYVKDVVKATIMAFPYNGFNIFNVATGIKTSFNQLIDFLNKTLGINYKPEYFDNPYTGSYQDLTVADMSKTHEKLGFKAEYSVEEGIKDYVKWLDEIGWYNE